MTEEQDDERHAYRTQLIRAKQAFDRYAKNHRDKIAGFEDQLGRTSNDLRIRDLRYSIEDTTIKAVANEELSKDIEVLLDRWL